MEEQESRHDDMDSRLRDAGVLERLIRIEVLLETKFNDIIKMLNDHEDRIRQNERWRYAAPLALVVAVGSALAAVITATGR